MSEKAKIAKEFAKIMFNGLLLILSMTAMYASIAFLIVAVFGVQIEYGLIISAPVTVIFVTLAAGITSAYYTAKFRVQSAKT